MTWQGIPFKYLGADQLHQAFLSVSHIPEIIVKSDFALDTFLSGLFAGLIPAAVAIMAMRSNVKNIQAERDHQRQLASASITAQIISASRQNWINELREAATQYIGAATTAINLNNYIEEEFKTNEFGKEYYTKILNDYRTTMGELGLIKTKIELLLNPDEEESKRVNTALDNIRIYLLGDESEIRFLDFKLFKPLSSEFKIGVYAIIKNEWVKLKDVA